MIVRAATIEDHADYVRLHAELGVDDAVPGRETFLTQLMHRMLVADDGGVVGYLLYEVMPETGYIRNVVADPARRRAGIGRALMEAARARFVAAGTTSWRLNVKRDNTAALALYARCGLAIAYRTVVMRIPREVSLGAPPGYVLEVLPAELDGVVEPRFALLAGQLANQRARPGRHVVQLIRDAEIVGAGVMMSGVPGCFPFRVLDRAHVEPFAALLRAQYAPPEAPWLQISAENDDGVEAEGMRLGAFVYLDLAHLEGHLDR